MYNKSIWDCSADEVTASFIPESECGHDVRIAFELKSGRIAAECPACGDVEYLEKDALQSGRNSV